jgi:phospholipid/cholesterol/gamma-HCH transport system substrate-binding protein
MREIRRELRTIVLLGGLIVLGLGVGAYLVVHQRIVWPTWLPVVGKQEFVLKARVAAISGVLPGQGQAVTISGVNVGQISGVSFQQGSPVITMQIDPKYSSRIHPNATILLRPKTGLNDMVAQLDPGNTSAGPSVNSGTTLGSDQTLPAVSLDEVLAQLDTDTRAELQMFVSNAGQALTDQGGSDLSDVFRRFDPLSQDVEKASRLIAKRSVELKQLMGNLSKLATELGAHDSQLTAFIQGNEGVFRALSNQDQNLQQTIQLLPPALTATNTALTHATKLGQTLTSAFTQLQPAAQGLGPTLRDLQPFFKETTPVLRDQLRPFSIKAKPTVKLLAPAAKQLAQATPKLGTLADELNNIVNELAYKPKNGQSYLFYLPWANHNTNSVLSTQDGTGPVRRGLILFSCGSLQLLQDLADPKHNPTLATLIQLLTTPDYATHCTGGLPKR